MCPTSHHLLTLVSVSVVLSSVSASAQTRSAQPATSDLSWVRDFSVPATGEAQEAHAAGKENRLNMDPRFEALLKGSLHQRQSFWFDHGRFTPVAELAHEFIGVPGSVLLDENRYVTVNGCVPHDCGDRGMVWIDTATAEKPTVIFAATGTVSNGPADRDSQTHLWLFSSMKLNWQKLSPQFRSSLIRWWNKTTEVWERSGPERIVLVTVVQPSGEMVDLSPSLFAFAQPAPPAKN